jgi:putative liporotein
MNFKKILKLSLLTMIIFLVQSCITVETDMNINSDFSGTTNSKIAIVKGAITEEQLKIEISKLGIEKYTLKKEKSSDEETDRYTVDINWKTEDDLRKILKFIGTGGKNSNITGNLSGQQSQNSGKNGENKDSKVEAKKIFTKEKGEIIVDMGTSKIAKLTIKVNGKIISEENQSGEIADSKKEITFYEGDKIQFKYKSGNGLTGIIFGVAVLAVLGVIGTVIFKKMKSKKSETIEEITVKDMEKNDADTTDN